VSTELSDSESECDSESESELDEYIDKLVSSWAAKASLSVLELSFLHV
jgi:hypothetical protein